jgi:alpha-methylacyl-CoA racemase
MMLADMGAEVVRIDRISKSLAEREKPSGDLLNRGRRSLGLNLKAREGVTTALRLIGEADVLLEGFRPGVMERLGLGPEVCCEKNPRLVYGRMTGWGQEGPIAKAAGHDINYIALSGVLHYIGRRGEGPVPPLNLVGDFGGGGMLLAFGVVAALVERAASGRGQVIDAAMTDGSALLATMLHTMQHSGRWSDERGTNILDTGAPYYDTYETKDGRYVAVGSIEPQFYAELLEKTGLDREELPKQNDEEAWPAMKERVAAVFRTKTRDQWCDIMEGSDVCFAPVLTMEEAYRHPQNVERDTFVSHYGKLQPAPAPRFSRTPPELTLPPPHPGEHTEETLTAWGFDAAEIRALQASETVG